MDPCIHLCSSHLSWLKGERNGRSSFPSKCLRLDSRVANRRLYHRMESETMIEWSLNVRRNSQPELVLKLSW